MIQYEEQQTQKDDESERVFTQKNIFVKESMCIFV